jgi:hypothetical protein
MSSSGTTPVVYVIEDDTDVATRIRDAIHEAADLR